MPDPIHLPENDPDLSLARQIGDALDRPGSMDGGLSPSVGSDAFVDALKAYKAEHGPPPAAPDVTRRMWTRLQQHIEADPSADRTRPRPGVVRPMPRHRLNWIAWTGMAASVVLLIGLVWIFASTSSEPTLLLATTDRSEMYTAEDGTTITLRPHSALSLLPSDGSDVRYQLVGEGYFDVTHNPNRVVSVSTQQGIVSVLGTQFNVSTWGNETTVFLETGRIRFEATDSGQSVELSPGQAARITTAGLVAPETEDEVEHLDWMRGEIAFASRPLQRILSELEHHYDVRIQVPESMQSEPYSGRILLNDKVQSINDLGIVMEGHFVEVQPNTYRFEQD